MQLRFGPGDDDAYEEARAALLDELDGWLGLSEPEKTEVVSDVGFFLDWRYHDSVGLLDDFAPAEIAEFLLDWCPHRLHGRPDDAAHVCYAVGTYVDFMAATGRLVGGLDRAKRLRRLADDLVPTVLAEVRDPTPVGALSDEWDEVPEKFGSAPFELPEPYELPFVYVPPSVADVETAAAAAPLLAKFAALRDYLGPDGKQLTDTGNLEVADGRALVELLDTGDELDPELLGEVRPISSTAALRQLNLIITFAEAAGAVRVRQRRLVPVKAWWKRPTIARAEALFAALLELGPLQAHSSGGSLYSDALHELLDDGIVHWLVPLLAHETAELPFDSILKLAESAVTEKQRLLWSGEDLVDEFDEEDVSRIFEVLEDAGVVRWTEREEVPQPFSPSYWTGGTVVLTAFGRYALPDYLDDAGYVLHCADGVADSDGAALIDALLSVDETQHGSVLAGWQPDRPAVERIQMITEAIAESSSAAGRMMGFIALHEFDIEIVEPLVRQLLDTPVAGHAALWLIERGRADAETLAGFVDIAVLVDVLSGSVEFPEELCSLFAGMSEPQQLLENMWRHPAPETAEVLDALGQHLPDRALAKAARKAAVRHRSWMANQISSE